MKSILNWLGILVAAAIVGLAFSVVYTVGYGHGAQDMQRTHRCAGNDGVTTPGPVITNPPPGAPRLR